MTRAALEGPIARTLLGLAWPVLAVLALQTFVGVAETYFVSFLGTSAIAGGALVFPLFMLMTMMSNGGIGGGVSSAVARAIGAGRSADAQALVLHAVAIAVAFGAVFTIGAWAGGPALFRYMGARDETLANAQLYSNVVFAAAIPGWIANLLGSALRGAGNVRVPATITAIGAVVTLGLYPCSSSATASCPDSASRARARLSFFSISLPRPGSQCTCTPIGRPCAYGRCAWNGACSATS